MADTGNPDIMFSHSAVVPTSKHFQSFFASWVLMRPNCL